MTMKSLMAIYVKFSLWRTALSAVRLGWILTLEFIYARDQQSCAEADRDPQDIGIREKTADL